MNQEKTYSVLLSTKNIDSEGLLLLLLHLLVSIAFSISPLLFPGHYAAINYYASLYWFFFPYILMAGFYRQLRNALYFGVFLLVAVVQVIYWLTLNPSAMALPSLLAMLIAFQISRILSLLIFKEEVIIPYRRISWWDEEDNRNVRWHDIMFSILIYGIIITSAIIPLDEWLNL
jgi:hypothetical protein